MQICYRLILSPQKEHKDIILSLFLTMTTFCLLTRLTPPTPAKCNPHMQVLHPATLQLKKLVIKIIQLLTLFCIHSAHLFNTCNMFLPCGTVTFLFVNGRDISFQMPLAQQREIEL